MKHLFNQELRANVLTIGLTLMKNRVTFHYRVFQSIILSPYVTGDDIVNRDTGERAFHCTRKQLKLRPEFPAETISAKIVCVGYAGDRCFVSHPAAAISIRALSRSLANAGNVTAIFKIHSLSLSEKILSNTLSTHSDYQNEITDACFVTRSSFED